MLSVAQRQIEAEPFQDAVTVGMRGIPVTFGVAIALVLVALSETTADVEPEAAYGPILEDVAPVRILSGPTIGPLAASLLDGRLSVAAARRFLGLLRTKGRSEAPEQQVERD